MPGTLFVVATPIGNLEDITVRAIRVLREVAVVAAEDTRRTGNLLRHFGIGTRLLSLHEHNEHARIGPLVGRLVAGESVALASDAGTPGVSDPGMRLVRAAIDAGVRVEPVPGPSAVLTALVGSGLEWSSFRFLGFAPARSKERRSWLARIAEDSDVSVFFEAPHRIRRTLGEMSAVLVKRQIVIAREMTKLHEEFLRGTSSEVLERLGEPRGEFTVVVSGRTGRAHAASQTLTDLQVAHLFGEMTENGAVSRKDAIRKVAVSTGMGANAVYDAVERHRVLGKSQNQEGS